MRVNANKRISPMIPLPHAKRHLFLFSILKKQELATSLRPKPISRKQQSKSISVYKYLPAPLKKQAKQTAALIRLQRKKLNKQAKAKLRQTKRTTALLSKQSRRNNRLFKKQYKKLLRQLGIRVKQSAAYQLLLTYFLSFFYTFKDYPSHVISALLLSAGILAGTALTYDQVFKNLPDPLGLRENNPQVTTRILSRDGDVLFRIYEDENRTIIPLEDMPPEVIFATIAIEDKEFFTHNGFSISGIIRAAVANSKGQKVQGGSTITQQLVKNRLLTSERTWTRKIRELLLSIMVERNFPKEEILEMYLNQVAYGGSTYGIEEAAQRYFGKSARDLNLAEASLIAGLPAAPSIYSPYGAYPELAFLRQEEVLRRMQEDGYITEEQAKQAIRQPLRLQRDVIDIKAPHFVMYVRKILADKFGEDVVQHGGLIVRTSLDLELQETTQEIVTKEVDKLARLKVTNGAALVTNPATGEILAMVGSKDYFDFDHDGQVNVTTRPRQPGSSIKPLTYSLALEKGMTPITRIDDSPVSYQVAGSPTYSPRNYDGTYHGRVTLREALGSSYNIPAVKTLATVGVSSMLDRGEEMGITTWGDRNRFGLSLTLGGGEVLMTDMAVLYGVFANSGKRVSLDPILEVTNYQGEVLYRNECVLDGRNCTNSQVLPAGVAYQITHILSDNHARTPAFGPQSTLYIPGQQVAVKTGTTNNLRDNWTIGYTSSRVVAVWVGNNDNSPMSYVASGITGASPIWNSIISNLLSDENPHSFAVPESVSITSVCSNGSIDCGWCTNTREEAFLRGTEPPRGCIDTADSDDTIRPASQSGRIRGRLTPATQIQL